MGDSAKDAPCEPFYPEMPPPDDEDICKEVELQRTRWSQFFASRGENFTEEWLWQYWRAEFRPKSQIYKKAMSMFSSRLTAQKKMKRLMRKGVPPELRGKIWYACSGAHNLKKATAALNQYSSLLGRLDELHNTAAFFDIEKDLKRTFPDDPRINCEKGVTILRRVLSCYALRNPDVGYCQSMNFIAALLLCHLSEERAFWTLAALIENILPADYYNSSMIGGRVDQQVFQSCLAWKIPPIQATLRNTRTGLEPVTTPWFLCLFINSLPLYTVCRIWDCLFWEGSIVLFRVALACMKVKQKQITESTDIISIYMLLKSSNHKASYDQLTVDMDDVYTGNGSSINSQGSGIGRSDSSVASNNSNPAAAALSSLYKGRQKSINFVMLHYAFGKSWLRSMPREPLDKLRVKIRAVSVLYIFVISHLLASFGRVGSDRARQRD
jgi:hypothetical protein